MIEEHSVQTSRLQVRYLQAGARNGAPVVFFHGNASSSTYWEESILALPDGYQGIAPDLRGYGLSPGDAIIDATRGVGDWVDDAFALLEALNIGRFHLVGHSLGGMVCWGVLADSRFVGRIQSATLVAPAPPCGFGGVRGSDARPNNPDFSGSGAGLVHPKLVELIAQGERGMPDPYFSPRAVMNRMFWKPPFRPAREEAFLSALLQAHLSQFPGDSIPSQYWPGFAPGRMGPINAIAAKYNQSLTRRVLDAPAKPPLLVMIGDADPVVSDASQPDAGYQVKTGARPGWPGEEVFPPQPVLTQLRSALSQYEERGGHVMQRILADCGHSPFIEKPREFQQLFSGLLRQVAARLL